MTHKHPIPADDGSAHDKSQGVARKPRAFRFSDLGWDEVKKAAERHGVGVAEYLRKTILELARGPYDTGSTAIFGRSCATDRANIPLHLHAPAEDTRRHDDPGTWRRDGGADQIGTRNSGFIAPRTLEIEQPSHVATLRTCPQDVEMSPAIENVPLSTTTSRDVMLFVRFRTVRKVGKGALFRLSRLRTI